MNGYGYQMPVQGNAYAGEGCNISTQDNVREFMGRQLSQPLVIGQNYYVSFYVSLADAPYEDCAINKIGIKFSTVLYDSLPWHPLTNSAQVYINTIVSDKTNWTKISGWFVADSAYSYIMLGNFFDNAHIDTLNCPTNAGTASYYFFDMVCVSTDSADCTIGNNESIPSVDFVSDHLKIFPVPANETLNIASASDAIDNLEIYTVVGKLIYTKSFGRINNITIPVANLANGIYLIKVVTKGNNFIHKVQIIH
jgi:hypothetical protein